MVAVFRKKSAISVLSPRLKGIFHITYEYLIWRNYGFTSANEIRQKGEKPKVQQVRLPARLAARALQTLQSARRPAKEVVICSVVAPAKSRGVDFDAKTL
jgi:hypothetical protein